MKYFVNIFLLLGFVCTFSHHVTAQTQYVRSATSQGYQKQFTALVNQGYRPIKVVATKIQIIDYGPLGLDYAATFEVRPNSNPWAARHGLTSAQYQSEFNTWVGQGYMPTDINIASYVGRQTSYSVIFEKVPNAPAWQAKHEMTYTTFASNDNTLQQQGFTRTILTKCRLANGEYMYAALWTK
jgi:hypothetical protein